jgi:hypothetical protein
MDPALMSLAGVVLGGGIASGTSVLVERTRSKRESKLERSRSDAETRTAARLVYDELDEIELLIDIAASSQAWSYRWDPPVRALPRAEWERHRATLATHLPDHPWGLLAGVYAELAAIHDHAIAIIDEERAMGVPEPHEIEARKIPTTLLARVDEAIAAVNHALSALAPFAGRSDRADAR